MVKRDPRFIGFLIGEAILTNYDYTDVQKAVNLIFSRFDRSVRLSFSCTKIINSSTGIESLTL